MHHDPAPVSSADNVTVNLSPGHTVTFANTPGHRQSIAVSSPLQPTSPQLKPVLKNTTDNVKKVELRVNTNPHRPRPRSVAVPNPATGPGSGLYDLEDVRLVSLPGGRQQEWIHNTLANDL